MSDQPLEPREININVPLLARVEGEGALELTIADDNIRELKLKIFEPPRLFEKMLEGRHYADVPDMVARICGICPVAYQVSAVLALEHLFETQVSDWVRDMRQVFYCGEWIQSHALHIHLLAAPDFLGYESALAMAKDYPEEVNRGFKLQALGNRLIKLLGARSVNPVGIKVGGFHHAPDPREVAALLEELQTAVADAKALLQWTLQLDLPDDHQGFTHVALEAGQDYPYMSRQIQVSGGQRIAIEDFAQHFKERQVPHSTALHCLFDNKPYLVGPLARINLNYPKLASPVRELVGLSDISFPSENTFHSIIARAAEIYHALLQAIEILSNYRRQKPYVPVNPKAGVAFGCSEAPRGLLWHRYQIDPQGKVVSANIVPPTSQNQAQIEADIRQSLQALGLNRCDNELRLRAEQVIRNYDPCISCATHFLTLNVNRP